jgi:hypothetical protein
MGFRFSTLKCRRPHGQNLSRMSAGRGEELANYSVNE